MTPKKPRQPGAGDPDVSTPSTGDSGSSTDAGGRSDDQGAGGIVTGANTGTDQDGSVNTTGRSGTPPAAADLPNDEDVAFLRDKVEEGVDDIVPLDDDELEELDLEPLDDDELEEFDLEPLDDEPSVFDIELPSEEDQLNEAGAFRLPPEGSAAWVTAEEDDEDDEDDEGAVPTPPVAPPPPPPPRAVPPPRVAPPPTLAKEVPSGQGRVDLEANGNATITFENRRFSLNYGNKTVIDETDNERASVRETGAVCDALNRHYMLQNYPLDVGVYAAGRLSFGFFPSRLGPIKAMFIGEGVTVDDAGGVNLNTGSIDYENTSSNFSIDNNHLSIRRSDPFNRGRIMSLEGTLTLQEMGKIKDFLNRQSELTSRGLRITDINSDGDITLVNTRPSAGPEAAENMMVTMSNVEVTDGKFIKAQGELGERRVIGFTIHESGRCELYNLEWVGYRAQIVDGSHRRPTPAELDAIAESLERDSSITRANIRISKIEGQGRLLIQNASDGGRDRGPGGPDPSEERRDEEYDFDRTFRIKGILLSRKEISAKGKLRDGARFIIRGNIARIVDEDGGEHIPVEIKMDEIAQMINNKLRSEGENFEAFCGPWGDISFRKKTERQEAGSESRGSRGGPEATIPPDFEDVDFNSGIIHEYEGTLHTGERFRVIDNRPRIWSESDQRFIPAEHGEAIDIAGHMDNILSMQPGLSDFEFRYNRVNLRIDIINGITGEVIGEGRRGPEAGGGGGPKKPNRAGLWEKFAGYKGWDGMKKDFKGLAELFGGEKSPETARMGLGERAVRATGSAIGNAAMWTISAPIRLAWGAVAVPVKAAKWLIGEKNTLHRDVVKLAGLVALWTGGRLATRMTIKESVAAIKSVPGLAVETLRSPWTFIKGVGNGVGRLASKGFNSTLHIKPPAKEGFFRKAFYRTKQGLGIVASPFAGVLGGLGGLFVGAKDGAIDAGRDVGSEIGETAFRARDAFSDSFQFGLLKGAFATGKGDEKWYQKMLPNILTGKSHIKTEDLSHLWLALSNAGIMDKYKKIKEENPGITFWQAFGQAAEGMKSGEVAKVAFAVKDVLNAEGALGTLIPGYFVVKSALAGDEAEAPAYKGGIIKTLADMDAKGFKAFIGGFDLGEMFEAHPTIATTTDELAELVVGGKKTQAKRLKAARAIKAMFGFDAKSQPPYEAFKQRVDKIQAKIDALRKEAAEDDETLARLGEFEAALDSAASVLTPSMDPDDGIAKPFLFAGIMAPPSVGKKTA